MPQRYRLYRRAYKSRDGQRRQTDTLWIDFRDHNNTRHRWPLDGSASACEQTAQRILALVDCRQRHDPPTPELFKWLDGAPEDLRRRIAAAALVDVGHASRNEALVSHLDGKRDAAGVLVMPGYRQHLEASDTPGHVEQTIKRVRRILDGCQLATWRDVCRPGAATVIRSYVGSLRKAEKRPLSVRTAGYYLRELKGFTAWMRADGRASHNPLEDMAGLQHEGQEEKGRRAFELGEMRALLEETARAKLDRFGMSADDRVRLYHFAYETGIRPGQIRKLTAANFDLDGEPPVVVTQARHVKRRTRHEQVLTPGMVKLLRPQLASKMPEAPLFATMPDKYTLAEMLRADLADARDAWIRAAGDDAKEAERRQRSDYLSPADRTGQRADFYSLRHTHGHTLGDAGLAQKDIAASLHHTRTATTDRYTRATIHARQKTVNSLPDVLPMTLRATGTDGRRGGRLRQNCAKPAEFGGRRRE
jgi:integrase